MFFFRVVSCGFVDKFFPPAYIELTLKHHGLHQSAIRIPQSAMRLVLFSPETFIILSPPKPRARDLRTVRALRVIKRGTMSDHLTRLRNRRAGLVVALSAALRAASALPLSCAF